MVLLASTVLFIYALVPNAKEETDRYAAEVACMYKGGFYNETEGCIIYDNQEN